MAEFNIRSDAIDVEQIMAQIRSRIREKRGVDYTEEEIRELASVKLDRFLDPKNVRSDLVRHYKQQGAPATDAESWPSTEEFDPASAYRSTRPGLVGRGLYAIRRLLNPILKLFFNPGPLLDSVSGQSRDLRRTTDILHKHVEAHAEHLRRRAEVDVLTYEVMNNLVVEMTRLAIEMKNHKMRVESVAARLDFDERRARALEETLQQQTRSDVPGSGSEGGGERRRRRRRRGRRGASNGDANNGGAEAAAPDATPPEPGPDRTETRAASDGDSRPARDSSDPDPES